MSRVTLVRVIPLLAVVLLCGESVFAAYCPIYYAGEWNGMKYYYCRKKNQCDYPLYYVVPDPTNHAISTCEDCPDSIAGNADEDMDDDPPAPDAGESESDLLGFHKKNGGVTDFVTKHSGKKPGDEPTGGSPVGGPGQFFSSGNHMRPVRDEHVKVTKDGTNYYFRLLTIKNKIDGVESFARIGQQLQSDPTNAKPAEFVKELGGAGSFHWKIKVQKPGGKYRHFYVLLKH